MQKFNILLHLTYRSYAIIVWAHATCMVRIFSRFLSTISSRIYHIFGHIQFMNRLGLGSILVGIVVVIPTPIPELERFSVAGIGILILKIGNLNFKIFQKLLNWNFLNYRNWNWNFLNYRNWEVFKLPELELLNRNWTQPWYVTCM